MSNSNKQKTVVGVDVGGNKKGFHGVAVQDTKVIDWVKSKDPSVIVNWAINHNAEVIAVDAPCRWSKDTKSRLCEQELNSKGIKCFYTPSRDKSLLKPFYTWMLNGEKIYKRLESSSYKYFSGVFIQDKTYIETFPHAITKTLLGNKDLTGSKGIIRRQLLTDLGYDITALSNIDYVDAALCAYAATQFNEENCTLYGESEEGIIVVPKAK